MNTQQLSKPRIELIDALRGFALMGLFLVHMVEYFELYWYKPEPGWVNTGVFFLFGAKAYAMFAMLFGLSFYIIMESQASKGVDFRAKFAWRLVILWFIGYLNSLIYSGEILQVLAISGLILLLVQHLSNKVILLIASFFLLQGPAWFYLIYISSEPALASSNPMHWGLMGAVFKVFANGSFVDVVSTNVWQSQLGKWAFFLENGRLSNIIGLFMVGLYLGRIAFFKHSGEKIKTLIKLMASSLTIVLVFTLLRSHFEAEPLSANLSQYILKASLNNFINNGWMFTGVCLFILAYQLDVMARLINLLAPCGRMSLTLYVGQGIVFVPLFFGYGLAWYETIGQEWSLYLGIVFWLVQMLIAHLWMKHFAYGPLEWLWRSATQLNFATPFKLR